MSPSRKTMKASPEAAASRTPSASIKNNRAPTAFASAFSDLARTASSISSRRDRISKIESSPGTAGAAPGSLAIGDLAPSRSPERLMRAKLRRARSIRSVKSGADRIAASNRTEAAASIVLLSASGSPSTIARERRRARSWKRSYKSATLRDWAEEAASVCWSSSSIELSPTATNPTASNATPAQRPTHAKSLKSTRRLANLTSAPQRSGAGSWSDGRRPVWSSADLGDFVQTSAISLARLREVETARRTVSPRALVGCPRRRLWRSGLRNACAAAGVPSPSELGSPRGSTPTQAFSPMVRLHAFAIAGAETIASTPTGRTTRFANTMSSNSVRWIAFFADPD